MDVRRAAYSLAGMFRGGGYTGTDGKGHGTFRVLTGSGLFVCPRKKYVSVKCATRTRIVAFMR